MKSNPEDMFFEGHVDHIRNEHVYGWVWDASQPNTPIPIVLLDSNWEILCLGVADVFRNDLYEAEKGNGAHGFILKLPSHVEKKNLHVLTLVNQFELIGSPVFATDEKKARPEFADIYQRLHYFVKYEKLISNHISHLEVEANRKLFALSQRLMQIDAHYSDNDLNFTITQKSLCDIFVFPPIDWSYRVQRPQRLAIGLAALGFRVWYISPHMLPTSDDSSYVVYGEPIHGVFLVKLRCSYPHPEINRSPINKEVIDELKHGISSLINDFKLRKICNLVGGAGWWTLINVLKSNLTIYDCMDWHAGFEATTDQLLDAELDLAKSADVVTCSSVTLKDYFFSISGSNNTFLIRNATHHEMFSLPAPKNTKNKVVGYVGAVEYWFDSELVIAVAQLLPDVKFMIVGHVHPRHNQLFQQPNIVCVGECDHSQVSCYIAQFHVGIIPFVENDLVKHTDPVKVYEYLAAGRPVVSTKMPELERFKGVVKIASTPVEFANELKFALRESSNRHIVKLRKDAVMMDTWAARAASFQGIIAARI